MIGKGMPKGNQNGSKIELWAFRGPISEVLGGFDRGQIFDEFLIGKKNEKNLKKMRRRCEKRISTARVGGRRRCPGEALESAKM
jgi:hypothetical protein